jgi:hypothetical protein
MDASNACSIGIRGALSECTTPSLPSPTQVKALVDANADASPKMRAWAASLLAVVGAASPSQQAEALRIVCEGAVVLALDNESHTTTPHPEPHGTAISAARSRLGEEAEEGEGEAALRLLAQVFCMRNARPAHRLMLSMLCSKLGQYHRTILAAALQHSLLAVGNSGGGNEHTAVHQLQLSLALQSLLTERQLAPVLHACATPVLAAAAAQMHGLLSSGNRAQSPPAALSATEAAGFAATAAAAAAGVGFHPFADELQDSTAAMAAVLKALVSAQHAQQTQQGIGGEGGAGPPSTPGGAPLADMARAVGEAVLLALQQGSLPADTLRSAAAALYHGTLLACSAEGMAPHTAATAAATAFALGLFCMEPPPSGTAAWVNKGDGGLASRLALLPLTSKVAAAQALLPACTPTLLMLPVVAKQAARAHSQQQQQQQQQSSRCLIDWALRFACTAMEVSLLKTSSVS